MKWKDLYGELYRMEQAEQKSLNGGAVLANQPLEGSFNVQNVIFTRGFLAGPEYAVDNFVWQTVPEPSTFLLTLLGLFVFVLRRRN